MLDVTHTVA